MKAEILYAYGRRSKHTFKCAAIHKWIQGFHTDGKTWIDPFFGENPFFVVDQNDIKESGMDSHDWIKNFRANSVDGVFFDPPYSMERVKRSYEGHGLTSWQKKYRNQSGSYPLLRDQIARVVRPGGTVLSFGWNSTGMGSGRGFKKEHVLLVCHSGAARDTICVMERKIK